MHKRNKVLAMLVLLGLVAAMLQGCSRSSAEEQPGTPIVYWTFNELHEQFFTEMAKQWNQTHPDELINLKANTFPYDNHHSKLSIALQSGVGAPDMADIEISKFGNFMKGIPQLVPLNPVVEPELGNVVKSRLDIYSKDSSYYGLDFHVGAEVMYYNKEILDKAGVNPDDIQTWDDYEKAGKQVLEKTGIPMTTVELNDQWSFWPLISQQNSDLLDEEGKMTLDNDTNIKTLSFLQRLVKEKIAVTAPGGGHHAEEYYGFMNKEGAASVWMPMWYMGRFTDYMPDLKGKMIIRPMPAWEKGGFRSAGMGGTATVITNQSEHADLAMRFLAFAKLSKEGNEQIWKQLGFDPIRTEVWTSPEVKEENKFTEYFGKNIFDTLIEVKDEINPVHIGPKTPDISSALKSKVMYRTLQDMEDPAEVLHEIAKELE
ncbi:extracellular solute-binding protein [Paenibacillus sp. JX-17]|uniref:Extracellular solute-binding protein n=1 Tax=Paenibacillus lacisoli TaxID=3064525 RepID=A0ABT9CEA1_9BACL|nr:extracellular solute-binding protein [Paenibacillus sp. JX-17]MDO7907546.1 extracellular solute-binding protein [Paenibacillus sp. JX-17]